MKKRQLWMYTGRMILTKVLTHFGVYGFTASIFSKLFFHHVVRPIVHYYIKHHVIHHIGYIDKKGEYQLISSSNPYVNIAKRKLDGK